MNKKISILCVLLSLGACSSNKKLDYTITDYSNEKKPVWIENLKKFEKKKDNDANTYKYFKSESESINKRLCEKSAIANANVAIASEITNQVDNLYSGLTEVQLEETLLSDTKKEQTKNLIKNDLVGVESKESYWEKRSYSTVLGAEKDKVTYYCYQLSRVKRSVHDQIINEMVNKTMKNIKNSATKEEVKTVVKDNAEDAEINLELKD